MPTPASQEERLRRLVVKLATEQGVTMSGLCNASSNTRRAFANDLLNLTLASPSANRHQRVDKDLAQWLPALNQCWDDNGNGRIICAEAERHGIAPVPRSHPAYQYMRDGDSDGVVCE